MKLIAQKLQVNKYTYDLIGKDENKKEEIVDFYPVEVTTKKQVFYRFQNPHDYLYLHLALQNLIFEGLETTPQTLDSIIISLKEYEEYRYAIQPEAGTQGLRLVSSNQKLKFGNAETRNAIWKKLTASPAQTCDVVNFEGLSKHFEWVTANRN